ncbi:WD40/YVTN repeat-like-containing domain containing protein [Trema orientale]|uniref:WD40/YVTN repeat-like-containing domain containing protein n=1 Tax=Trema orientale TaxID=63057 RepID=A0A2P5F9F2_TREOI|nr:WD40/YVTN repeat-like-containing domain containing protein [Trema orientale]
MGEFVFKYSDGLELRLISEGDVGESLAWDPRREGYILSASLAHNISLWDLSALPRQPKTLSPVHVFGVF